MIKQQIKVVISDLDGTLLNSEHRISSYTKSVLKELYEQKFLVIVATGRHHLDAMSIIGDLEFPIYLVSSNGARIHSPNKELLYSLDIKSEAIKSILSLEIDPEITVVLFKENVWQTSKANKKLNSFQTEMKYQPEVVDFSILEDYSGIKLFFTHDNHQNLVELRDKIIAKYPDDFSHAFSLPLCLEFMDKTVDKSVAIAKILEIEGFTFEESISFGDGFNDEKMLLSTGVGLIMENAPESLKEKLSHLKIISSNNSDGVANYISKHILKEKISLNNIDC